MIFHIASSDICSKIGRQDVQRNLANWDFPPGCEQLGKVIKILATCVNSFSPGSNSQYFKIDAFLSHTCYSNLEIPNVFCTFSGVGGARTDLVGV